jgi:hypothetical protein
MGEVEIPWEGKRRISQKERERDAALGGILSNSNGPGQGRLILVLRQETGDASPDGLLTERTG